MQTRRDQLQAYRYLIRRVMTSLLGTEPEAPEQPMRRVVAGTMSGILIAVIAGGIVGAVGFFTKGGATSWKEGTNLVIEKETGTSYVYREEKKTLNPVLNYTSAVLLVGADTDPIKASRDDLAGTKIGPQIGILGAPSSLPETTSVTSSPWTACSTMQESDDGSEPTDRVDVLVGRKDIGSTNLGRHAVVVRPTGNSTDLYLLWNNKKFATDESSLNSLGVTSQTAVDPVPMPPEVLNTIPTGAALRPMQPPSGGSVTVGDVQASTGDVVRARDVADEQNYVVLGDGLAPIHLTEADLLLGSGAGLHRASAAEINDAPQSDQQVQTDVPPTAPELAELPQGTTTPLCVWSRSANAENDSAWITYGGDIPAGSTTRQVGAQPSAMTADRVWLEPGSVALIEVLPGPGLPSSEYALINSAGVRFPIPKKKATLDQLGYGDVTLGKVNRRFIDLLPTGPALDETNAQKQVGTGSGQATGGNN